MGSSSSKTRRIEDDADTASSFSSSTRKFLSSYYCLGSSSRAYHSGDDNDIDDPQVLGHCDEVSGICTQQTESESDKVKVECYQTAKTDGTDDVSCVSSNVELGEWTHTSTEDNMTRGGDSSSQAFSDRSLNRSSRFLSRFSFVPESLSFRLSRGASVGSSRSYPYPASFTVSTGEEGLPLHGGLSELINRNENQHNVNLNSSSLYSASVRSHNSDTSMNLLPYAASQTFSSSSQDDRIISEQDLAGNDNERARTGLGNWPFGTHMDTENFYRRPSDHRNGSQEPVDQNVHFSRTHSVGRLHDRVLRQSSFSDLTPSLQQERIAVSDESPVNSLLSSQYPWQSRPHSLYSSQNNDVGTSHPRETMNDDSLENSSNISEGRRRIRSQGRALQHLGSRFENLSGHERQCIRSGQHRTGHCSCSIGTRDSRLNDDRGARASISRIVLLAEALFEVLDEIHQQSVVLSSRSSTSSVGSVPAPHEVVESLPVKVYDKSTIFQCEEVAQCYICLVEYEEGDEMRVLPCRHEFHKICIDKWLKEIHRICPVCRGNIC